MTTVKVFGGLGNQMFQYAIGKVVAKRKQEDLFLDITWFNRKKNRQFELDHFHLSYSITPLFLVYAYKFLLHMLRICGLENRCCVYNEQKTFFFDEKVFRKPYAYIAGYFQNPQYFEEIRDELVKDFTPKRSLQGASRTIAEKMRQENSVAVHMRRGDYMSGSLATKYVTQSIDYYLKAMGYMSADIDNPQFYIFSDDINWCKETLKMDKRNLVYIDSSVSSSALNDFLLMKSCRHYIISNSTFSWWAAWLSETEDKRVIAPQRWFFHEGKDTDSKQLINPDWVLM